MSHLISLTVSILPQTSQNVCKAWLFEDPNPATIQLSPLVPLELICARLVACVVVCMHLSDVVVAQQSTLTTFSWDTEEVRTWGVEQHHCLILWDKACRLSTKCVASLLGLAGSYNAYTMYVWVWTNTQNLLKKSQHHSCCVWLWVSLNCTSRIEILLSFCPKTSQLRNKLWLMGLYVDGYTFLTLWTVS